MPITPAGSFIDNPSSGTSIPLTTYGDMLYENGTPALARLAGNVNQTRQYLSELGASALTPILIQSAKKVDVSGTSHLTFAQAFSSNNTAGSLLFVAVTWYGSGYTASVADSQGNSGWTAVAAQVTNTTTTQAFYCPKCKAGANTVTVTFSNSAASYQTLTIAEFANVNTLETKAQTTGSGTTAAGGSITPTATTSLVVGYAGSNINGYNSPSAPWALIGNGASCDGQVEYQIAPAGTYAAAFPLTGSDAWQGGTASFYWAPVAFVQATDAYDGSGGASTTYSNAFVSNNTAGNLLFVVISYESGVSITSISDTNGNAYVAIPAVTSSTHVTQAFYAMGCRAGANTVTVAFSGAGATYPDLIISEYSGVNAIGSSTTATGSSNAPASGNITAAPWSLILGYGDEGSCNWTAGVSWTLRSTAGSRRSALEDQLNVASGAYSATFSINVSSSWRAGIVCFYQTFTGTSAPAWSTPSAADLANGTTGSGAVVLATSPTLVNPNIGAATATTPSAGDSSTKVATTAFVSGASANTLNVNGSMVVSPFDVNVLINGSGVGGQVNVNGTPAETAIPCMVENPVNLTNGQRALGTVYYNNTGLPILVVVSVFSNTANVVYTALADSSAVPSTVIYKTVGDNNSSFNDVSLTFFVLPGQYYKVTASTGITTIEGWREFICQRGAITDSGDLSGSKALSTVYQNTSGKTKFVMVQVASVNAASAVLGLSDSSPVPTNVVDSFMQNSSGASTVTVIIIVPNGHYYKVTAASGSLSLWHEYSWAISCHKSTDLILTSGSGWLRTGAGAAAQVNTGSGTSTYGSQQYWQNNTQAVRWVQVITASGAADSFCQMAAGDGIPPYQILSVCRRHTAASSRHVYGPVLPGKTYAFLDTTNSTLTQSHWWEYQLG